MAAWDLHHSYSYQGFNLKQSLGPIQLTQQLGCFEEKARFCFIFSMAGFLRFTHRYAINSRLVTLSLLSKTVVLSFKYNKHNIIRR